MVSQAFKLCALLAILVLVGIGGLVCAYFFRLPEEPQYERVGVCYRPKASPMRSRLPSDVIPTHYIVDIIPFIDPMDPDTFGKAPGNVTITLTCVKPTSKITMHSYDIVIPGNSVKVKDSAEVDFPVMGQSFDINTETFTIELSLPLVAEKVYTVHIQFEARVAEDRKCGLYLHPSVEPDSGLTNYHAATHFEATAARMAFPCFDEPALKATFEFRIGRKRAGFHTLWNMEKNETVPIDGRDGYAWDVYPPTPVRMSTYLLAIIVSNFEVEIAPEGLYRKPVRIWGPKGLMNSSDHGAFASETAAKILTFFEEYLDYEYDFPKMDSVAAPGFQSGGMENWGLSIYNTRFLLYTEGESTQDDKWRIVVLLAHELAHQWWGNLVTMKWWNDLWIKEGLSSYMSFQAANATVPQFEPLQRVTIDSLQTALDFDGDSRYTVPIRGPDEVNGSTVANPIIYDKGASLVRMMSAFLTHKTLLQGLRNYLKDKAYGNAVQDELFQHLTTQAHADGTLAPDTTVKEIMDTWTLQAGFPIIWVYKTMKSYMIGFTQERFIKDPLQRSLNNETAFSSKSNASWYIPIAYISKSRPALNAESLAPKFWMNKVEVFLQDEETNEWILVNPDVHGYYRVLYDEHFGRLLQEQLMLDHEQIPALSRAQLLDDHFKSAYAEYISIHEALKYTVYLNKENELPVWTTVIQNLKPSLTILGGSELREVFNLTKVYLLEKVNEPLQRIGAVPFVRESPIRTLLRTQLLGWACALGHELCYSTASKLFATWMAHKDTDNPITADLQPLMYCAAAAKAGANDSIWNFILGKYNDSGLRSTQTDIWHTALGACTTNKDNILSLIDMVGNETSILGTDTGRCWDLMYKIGTNLFGRDLVFEYIKTNTKGILEDKRLGWVPISAAVTGVSTSYSTIEAKAEMQKFLDDNTDNFEDDLKVVIKNAITRIGSNIKWIAIHGPRFQEFVEEQGVKL